MATPNEERAFADLIGRHQVQLMGYIYALVHNLDDAEDVYQQTSIVLWQKFTEFDLDTDFMAWAATIARYEVLNFVRTNKIRSRYFSDSLMLEFAVDQSAEANAERSERGEALSGCVDKLSDADRCLIEQCYDGTCTVQEVAQQHGRPVKSVYASLSRIRRALFVCITRVLRGEGDS